MSEWQLIETAPKDGTPILLYATRHTMLREKQQLIVGWYNRGWWTDSAVLSHASHWQPLPAPPTK